MFTLSRKPVIIIINKQPAFHEWFTCSVFVKIYVYQKLNYNRIYMSLKNKSLTLSSSRFICRMTYMYSVYWLSQFILALYIIKLQIIFDQKQFLCWFLTFFVFKDDARWRGKYKLFHFISCTCIYSHNIFSIKFKHLKMNGTGNYI